MEGLVAGTNRFDPNRCQFYNPVSLDLQALLPEVPLGFERPVEATDDPICQALDVNLYLCIDFWAPRWKLGTVLDEAINGFLAEVSNEVNGFLEGHAVVTHHDYDHVMCVGFGLFTVVREDILENVGSEKQSRVYNLLYSLTLDQVTKSFVASSKFWIIG